MATSNPTIVKKTSTNYITNQYWLALQLVLTKVMARAKSTFFTWAVGLDKYQEQKKNIYIYIYGQF